MPPVRVAVVQAGSALFDTPSTLDRLAARPPAPARRGAGLVVFREAFVGGSPRGLGFGAVMGSRPPAGGDEFRRYFDAAVDVPGPATAAIGEVARTHDL